MMNGLPPKQCKAFVLQMQNVKEETAHNMVYNGITIESVPSFKNVTIPVIAIAGEKEQKEVRDSVRKMAEINANCRCEIWDKAAHNIPPLFAGKFNELIRSMLPSVDKGTHGFECHRQHLAALSSLSSDKEASVVCLANCRP